MPRVIVKPSPDIDLYIDWSTVSDAPCRVGSREEMLGGGIDAERLDAADRNGSSANESWRAGWWRDKGFIVQDFWAAKPHAWIPRANLLALARALLRGDPDPLAGLTIESEP